MSLLGHWRGRSVRNTMTSLHHCIIDILEIALLIDLNAQLRIGASLTVL